ncbi:NADH-quinone oxidoreductase subunit E [Rhizobium sp. P38BS-XIX]|uniref:NADH-quinone oxidoreductase subunit E n=1 Tax=Rhizobium sp. P38BS-XIX TaxID=2726740 RepID=UPI001456E814|nr:NADH-quinone oxidoreductase subunit E [Rhizobium sp. P38BS-XIX]NLR95708.1 NADH-quinone oxidoreductase subunit E [Rhizobium sp. P38BS-XIX]
MSVRRLAEDQFQPAAFAFSDENAVWAEKTIKKYPEGRQQSAIIPLLMRAQEQDGWVTRPAIETIADMLDMAYIRALEVATFYTQFQLHPVGTRAHVQVCGTTPCMLRGAEGLIKVCKSKINAHAFDRNEDGTLSWEEVECQGACVNAPMVVIGKDTYEDLTPTRLEEIIDAFAAGKGHEIATGPQIDRVFSAPEGGLTSLLSDEAKAKSVADKTAKAAAEAVSIPPSEAARVKSTDAETNQSLKTPATAPKESAKNAKIVETAAEPAAGKPSLDDKDRPAGIERPAQPDNLQLISGVGPKIEGTLHELGIFTFAQIASWHEAERHWVDGYLNFKGRIERDEWVKQAEALAKGGEAEYIKVFGKKPR